MEIPGEEVWVCDNRLTILQTLPRVAACLMPSPPSTTKVSACFMGVLMALALPQLPASSQIVFGFGHELYP